MAFFRLLVVLKERQICLIKGAGKPVRQGVPGAAWRGALWLLEGEPASAAPNEATEWLGSCEQ